MGFKWQSKFFFSSLTHFTSRNLTDLSPLCIKQKQPNPLQQDSPVPSLPRKKTPRQPTPGASCTQGLEDLFHKPSQTNEPPIPGPIPSSKPHEDVPACEPEPEVVPTQSMKDPLSCPTPPHSIIIIDDTPVGSPLPNPTTFPLCSPSLPVTSSPHSHNEACREFTDLKPTLITPRAIVHKSINRILLEQC
ncbi:hypothetical protein O181_078641 [Austropuccinia psidii MF-1]|uniref:Uncharacterized protein n=1 Tax=Austropuccinia psidii MF-1 TaxID=1389203 RepID=A0A9Q3FKD7_9BASI|nr:hypothetical protein [Austropuccinia psidii MF-1]